MPEVTTLFWDVGGVMLTNGWDRAAREKAVAQFALDREDFEDRHEMANQAFETAQITLDQYLERTIFYRSRSFTPDEFKTVFFAQSRELPESRAVARGVARSGKYLMAVINNEALELNLHRIERFDLRRDFTAFFSSCFVGLRKPDEAIYRLALEVTQRDARHCVFIDDRARNLECPQRLGMGTIHFQNAAQLREELRRSGVDVPQNSSGRE